MSDTDKKEITITRDISWLFSGDIHDLIENLERVVKKYPRATNIDVDQLGAGDVWEVLLITRLETDEELDNRLEQEREVRGEG